jgi:hypothetical protein
MTNAEFRTIALEAALMKADGNTIKDLCKDLSKTERNFILKRGEKTITQILIDSEAERDKSLAVMVESIVKSLSQGLKSPMGGTSASQVR